MEQLRKEVSNFELENSPNFGQNLVYTSTFVSLERLIGSPFNFIIAWWTVITSFSLVLK